ncbi:MAG: class I SAM-dependent methyltransferase, partial [bacterium]
FLKRQLPLPRHAAVLDVCAGRGRIAGPRSLLGYRITAVDRNADCVQQGAERFPGIAFRELDMRKLPTLGQRFDGIVCLWQSFGFFDAAPNRQVLQDMAGRLNPGGRIILDLYHRDYFARRQGVESSTIAGARIDTERRMKGNRLEVRIDYGGGRTDDFSWELYAPRDAIELGVNCGLAAVLLAANFDEATSPASDKASFQLVLTNGKG